MNSCGKLYLDKKVMNKILVIDDTAFWRELAADAMRLKGYQVVCAADGIQALEALRVHGADLILLDVEMPNLDGFAFLRQVRLHEKWKDIAVIMLTGSMGREDVLRAKELGAAEYLIKAQFSLDALLSRVRKRLPVLPAPSASKPAAPPARRAAAPPAMGPAPMGWGAGHTREQTLRSLEQLPQLQALAGTVNMVLSLANSSTASIKDLAQIICQDAVLSARILQVANSVAYTTSNVMVNNLEEAAKRIGTAGITQIAVSAGVYDAMQSPGSASVGLLRCWQHAFAAAQILANLAPSNQSLEAGTLHLAGLCHDLDEILLRQRFAQEYAALESEAAHEGVLPAQKLPKYFGLSRSELVAHVMMVLHLPHTVAGPIQEYAEHETQTAQRDRSTMSLAARWLRLADMCAAGLLLTASSQAAVAPLSQAECRALGLSPAAWDPMALRSQIISAIGLLSRIKATDQAEFFQPLLGRQERRIWYVRHSSLSVLDPVRSALACLYQMEDHDQLPSDGSDMGGLAGIVVACPRGDGPELTYAQARSAARLAPGAAPTPLLYLTAPEFPMVQRKADDCALWPVSLSRLAALAA
jgi:CheY-like chemotaxis protein